jgi:hypothetical protein
MTLITRQGKGTKLTIQEMDGNLTYLEQQSLSGRTQWEADGEGLIRPKDNKKIDASHVENLPTPEIDLSEVSEDIVPLFDGVYDIGTEEKKWFDGYFTNKVQIGNSSIQTDEDSDLTLNSNLIVQGTVSSEIGDFGDITISGNTISKISDEYEGGDEKIIVEGDLDINGEILQNGEPLSSGVIQEGAGTGSTVRIDNNNIASGCFSTVSGGRSNTSSGCYSTIGGGGGLYGPNTSSGFVSTVGGGRGNTSSNYASTVGGGVQNTSSGIQSTIGGGVQNTSSGCFSTISGGKINTSSNHASTVGGGLQNTSSGYNSTVGGGCSNNASGIQSTIGGGRYNTASGSQSTVGGGFQNTSSNEFSTVGGGRCSTASGPYSIIGGGGGNYAGNTSSGIHTGILGGRNNSTNNCNCAMIVGSCITADRECTTFVNNLSIKNIPTSSVGLPSGSVWNDSGTLKIV